MADAARTEPFEIDANEPLGLLATPLPDDASGARRLRFELSSRGDRAIGTLTLPATARSDRWLLVAEAAAGPLAWRPACAPEDLAVARLDLPLHGARVSAKLGDRLAAEVEAAARGQVPSPASEILWIEFVRQTVSDLRRCIDGLGTLDGLAESGAIVVAAGLGTLGAVALGGLDPRPRGAVLLGGVGALGPAEVDPVRFASGWKGRPVLAVGSRAPGALPPEKTEALHAALEGSAQLHWSDETPVEHVRSFLAGLA